MKALTSHTIIVIATTGLLPACTFPEPIYTNQVAASFAGLPIATTQSNQVKINAEACAARINRHRNNARGSFIARTLVTSFGGLVGAAGGVTAAVVDGETEKSIGGATAAIGGGVAAVGQFVVTPFTGDTNELLGLHAKASRSWDEAVLYADKVRDGTVKTSVSFDSKDPRWDIDLSQYGTDCQVSKEASGQWCAHYEKETKRCDRPLAPCNLFKLDVSGGNRLRGSNGDTPVDDNDGICYIEVECKTKNNADNVKQLQQALSRCLRDQAPPSTQADPLTGVAVEGSE